MTNLNSNAQLDPMTLAVCDRRQTASEALVCARRWPRLLL